MWSAAKRIPKLGAVGLFIAVAIGAALWFALSGPAARAGAVAGALATVASTVVALAAIYLSKEALARTDQQLASARRATILSRYPLLLPIHQSVAFPESSDNIASHPPTETRFRLTTASFGCYAFIADTNDRFIIPIENAGEGPALQITGELWRSDGTMGEVIGPSALGTGRIAIMTAALQDVRKPIPEAFEEALKDTGGDTGRAFYWLALSYFDVFSNMFDAHALFDPRGLGVWIHGHEPRVEPTTQENSSSTG